jgi:DNA-binding NarL/FixJ family response regulator
MPAPALSPLRIVIAEDAAIMRDGLTQTLTRRGHDVVAAVGDAAALLEAVALHEPDVAVIDVRMPPTTPMRDCGPRSPSAASILASACSSSPSTSRQDLPPT